MSGARNSFAGNFASLRVLYQGLGFRVWGFGSRGPLSTVSLGAPSVKVLSRLWSVGFKGPCTPIDYSLYAGLTVVPIWVPCTQSVWGLIGRFAGVFS